MKSDHLVAYTDTISNVELQVIFSPTMAPNSTPHRKYLSKIGETLKQFRIQCRGGYRVHFPDSSAARPSTALQPTRYTLQQAPQLRHSSSFGTIDDSIERPTHADNDDNNDESAVASNCKESGNSRVVKNDASGREDESEHFIDEDDDDDDPDHQTDDKNPDHYDTADSHDGFMKDEMKQ